MIARGKKTTIFSFENMAKMYNSTDNTRYRYTFLTLLFVIARIKLKRPDKRKKEPRGSANPDI